MATAIVTGGSKGLGAALVRGLAGAGWSVVTDARHPEGLDALQRECGGRVAAIRGDVTDPAHRRALAVEAARLGDVQLVVNNAGALGPSPLPSLVDYPPDDLAGVLEANVISPLALIQELAPLLDRAARPRVVNITSDAAVEAFEGWGGYGASKAALEQLGAVLKIEKPGWTVWTVDPGDLRTDMHQAAFPGEDISDRPEPAQVVPAFLVLIRSEQPSGRYRLSDIQLEPEGASA
jgi:NAD(P)-dependent dehydrogenase (short-subunit alcohol dehydrogenase family)